MRSTAVIVACCCWAGLSGAAPAEVAARMRNVVLHMGNGVDLQIDDLRGHLASRKSGPPVFDDVDSYVMNVEYARVRMSPESLSSLMNNYVFASDDAPIKKVAIAIEGNELVQTGVLKKGVPVPFRMRASVSTATDGRLRIHPTQLKAAGFLSKRVLDFFGVDLEKLVDVKDSPGVAVDGDDLLLEPTRALPPPRMQGKATRAWIENGRMVIQFGDPKASAVEPPVPSRNYMYYRGGVLKFGKLTMDDVDLLLTDSDPDDPFDFSPERYNDQLVAGYSKNTKAHGLVVHMPDANDLTAPKRKTSS